MSGFKPYPAYKDSRVPWIGEVPITWEVKPFKWLLDSNDGGVWGDDPTGEEDTLVLRSTDQTVDGNWKLTDPAPRKLSAKEKASALLAEGDLVVTKSSGSSLHIGKTTLVTADIAKQGCCFGNFMQRLRVNSGFTPKLTWYVMNNELARAQLDLLSNSTTGLANLNGTLIGEILLPVSTVAEQTQIARFLDHETARIDTLIAEQQRLIELLKEKRQAVISHAVTKGLDPTVPMKDSGVEWLGEVPAHWNVIRLGQNIRTRKGFAFSAADFSDEGAAVVKASDIKNHSINEPNTFIGFEFLKNTPNAILRKGNLVLSTVGSTPDVKNSAVGQIGCVPEHLDGALLNQNTVIFEPTGSRVSSEYLFFALLTTAYRDHLDINAHGTANQASLSLSDMLSFCIPLPDLDEQKAISSELSRVLENVKALERESESLVGLLTERRSALISAAVTGKIDVRDWQPPASAQAPKLEEIEAV